MSVFAISSLQDMHALFRDKPSRPQMRHDRPWGPCSRSHACGLQLAGKADSAQLALERNQLQSEHMYGLLLIMTDVVTFGR